MTSKQAEEAARQEAISRGYGPRMADWFVRGAYAAATGAEHAPSRRPTRAWYLDGTRWYVAASGATTAQEASP